MYVVYPTTTAPVARWVSRNFPLVRVANMLYVKCVGAVTHRLWE